MGEIVVTLPLPPLDVDALSPVVLDYADEVATILHGQQVPVGAPVHISARFYFLDRCKRDLDNGLRLLLDVISRCLGFDDSRIDELRVYRSLDRKKPRVEMHLMWNALPSHCAWCEPPPTRRATSGICNYHKMMMLQQVGERAGAK